jgi:arginase
LDYGSTLFKQIDSVEIPHQNQLLFETQGSPYAKRIKGVLSLYEKLSAEVSNTLKKMAFL